MTHSHRHAQCSSHTRTHAHTHTECAACTACGDGDGRVVVEKDADGPLQVGLELADAARRADRTAQRDSSPQSHTRLRGERKGGGGACVVILQRATRSMTSAHVGVPPAGRPVSANCGGSALRGARAARLVLALTSRITCGPLHAPLARAGVLPATSTDRTASHR